MSLSPEQLNKLLASMPDRYPVAAALAITEKDTVKFVACNDGSMWIKTNRHSWKRVDDIPQPGNEGAE